MASAAPASAAEPQFGAPIETAVDFGASPTSVAAGDVNNDGHTDLAVVLDHGTDPSAFILLGDGKGGFREGPIPPIAGAPGQALLRDVNGDGNQDLLVAESDGQFLHVLLGAGDGTFTAGPAPTYFGAYGVIAIATADFNRDGHVDVAAVTQSAQAVSVVLGDGTGKFKQAPSGISPVSGRPSSIAVGDLNQDGAPDVAATTDANEVWVFLGAGDGTLHQAPASPFATGDYPDSLSVADMDLDGHRDLVYFSSYYRVNAFRGDGKGGFGEPAALIVPRTRPRDVIVADFDHRLGPDVALDETGVVRPYMNDGHGAFAEAAGSPYITSHWSDASAADVTGDGYADLVGVTQFAVSVLPDNPPPQPAPGGDGGNGGAAPPPTAPKVVVPGVQGMTIAAARHRLARHHLRVGEIRGPRHGDRHHVIRVAGQSPRRGAKVTRNATVRLQLRRYRRRLAPEG